MLKKQFILPALSISLLTVFSMGYASTPVSTGALNHDTTLFTNASKAGLNPSVLTHAIKGYDWAKAQGKVKNTDILTVVNFALPSKDKRLWVLDLKNDKVLMNTYVANGSASGRYVSTHFSNAINSHESSLGVYTTGLTPFYGKHGRSLKVIGLESGINSNAYTRAIEVHGSDYVSPYFAKNYGRVGGSWGCFAVDKTKIHQLVSDTVGGSVIFAYAPQENSDPVVNA